jgi:hypothetical protein
LSIAYLDDRHLLRVAQRERILDRAARGRDVDGRLADAAALGAGDGAEDAALEVDDGVREAGGKAGLGACALLVHGDGEDGERQEEHDDRVGEGVR